MNQKKFFVQFHKDAEKEYARLDSSIVKIVNNAVDELEERADEVGKPLGNNDTTKLSGCKEIKFRELGIRIVFRITNKTVELLRIVEILAIGKRDKDMVFKDAHRRIIAAKVNLRIKRKKRGK